MLPQPEVKLSPQTYIAFGKSFVKRLQSWRHHRELRVALLEVKGLLTMFVGVVTLCYQHQCCVVLITPTNIVRVLRLVAKKTPPNNTKDNFISDKKFNTLILI